MCKTKIGVSYNQSRYNESLRVVINRKLGLSIVDLAVRNKIPLEIRYAKKTIILTASMRNKNLFKKLIFIAETKLSLENICPGCSAKLISDKLSEKYGNYCPNLKCNYIK